MYSKIVSGTLVGTDAEEIMVESDVSFGFPSFSIVGLPDTAIRESKERVRIAMANSGFTFPDKRVTVNLSPAGVRKEGTHFDLPVAVGILVSAGYAKAKMSEGIAFLGELALDGKINRIKGALPLIIGLREKGVRKIVIPEENSLEGSMVKDAEIFSAASLKEVARFLNGRGQLKSVRFQRDIIGEMHYDGPDFYDVTGHESAKRALQLAASAMHNVLLTGPPGSGKTLLARCVPSILPPMDYEEMIEVTKIYSMFGLLDDENPVIKQRPFRSPDHTVTPAALIGGGSKAKAGEVSLAHLGVLFLDEFPEFSRMSLEALRKPLEDEVCTISRVSGSITLPSRFILVAAMNPCPCGFLGDDRNQCICSQSSILRYRSKLSGPILDRIDMTVDVRTPDLEDIRMRKKGVSSAELRTAVIKARKIQSERFKNENIKYNSQMKSDQLKKYCIMEKDAQKLLDDAFERFNLSVRSYDRIIKVARTAADLDDDEVIGIQHIAEAISYKCDSDIFR